MPTTDTLFSEYVWRTAQESHRDKDRRVLQALPLEATRDQLIVWGVYLFICVIVTVFMVRYASRKVRLPILVLTIVAWCVSLFCIPLFMLDMYSMRMGAVLSDRTFYLLWSLYFLATLTLRW